MSVVAKFIAALIGAAGSVLSAGVLPDSVAKWVAVGIAALTAIAVYLVPNAPKPAPTVSRSFNFWPHVQLPPDK